MSKSYRVRVLCGVSALAAALIFPPQPVLAQSAPDAEQAQDEFGPTRLDEIIVTARKREESALEAPVAVTAITAGQIEQEDIQEIADIVDRVPGIDLGTIGAEFADPIVIRGQGQGRQINAETQTGLYRNGSFIAGGNIGGSTFSRMDLFDIQSVEAYRGPQGASYGRNALGGAVNIVNATPTDEFGGYASIRYGTNERIELEGVLNIPLTENFASRIGVYYADQSEGFYTNTFLDAVPDREDFLGLRGQIGGTTDAGLDINLLLEYFNEDAPSFAHRAVRRPGPNPVTGVTPDFDPFVRSYNIDNRFKRDEFFAQLRLQKSFDNFDLTSISFLKDRQADTIDDLDAQQGFNFGAGNPLSPIGNTIRQADDDFLRYGTELRFSSPDDGRRLSWVAGGEVLFLEDDYVQEFSGFAGPLAAANTLVSSVSEDTNFALFGLIGYDITDALNLSGELRYSYDDKSIEIDSTRIVIPTGPVQETFAFDESFEKLSPTVTLSYDLNDTVSTYLRYSTGFRAGGFNLTPDPVPPADFSLVYDQEEAVNYEAGIKGAFLDGRFGGAATVYLIEGEDVLLNDQLRIGVPPNSRNINFVKNGPSTESYGLELEGFGMITLPSQLGILRLNATLALADGEFTGTVPFIAAGAGDLTGRSVPFLRDEAISIATTWSRRFANDWRASLTHSWRAQYGGLNGIAVDANNVPTQVRQDISLHQFRAALSNGRIRLSAGVENAFDDDYFVNETIQGTVTPGTPREWFAELRMNF